LNPDDNLVDWKAERALDRLSNCVLFLAVHGFLTDAEEERIRGRIAQWVKDAKPRPKRKKKETTQ
jgi:hypothetical protein